jgi:cell division protein FtsQ
VAGRRPRAQGPPPRARAAAARLPRLTASSARIAPSRRSLAVGLGLLALALGGYFAARESSAFAVDRLEVTGAPVDVQRAVRRAVRPFVGANLLSLDGAALVARVEALPTVVSVRYDRGFPHTLRLRVVPETPVAVVHRGRSTWLVSARGRVMSRIPPGSEPGLARIWVKRAATVTVGDFLAPATGGTTARALALATRFPARIATATLAHGAVVLRLRSGLELRLGEPTDLRLKLAIARRALAQLPAGSAYVDVSLPGRPVAGPAAAPVAAENSQLSSGG